MNHLPPELRLLRMFLILVFFVICLLFLYGLRQQTLDAQTDQIRGLMGQCNSIPH